jgi:hypothetical protein
VVILRGETPLREFVPVNIDGALTFDLTGQVELKRGRVITLRA